MLSLTKELEHTFAYKGQLFNVNLSFDNVLRWYELMEDEELEDQDKAEIGFEMFFNACPLDPDLLLKGTENIAKYIQQHPYGNGQSGDGESGDPEKDFSYTQDAAAIYDSILEQYHIDLIDQQGKLHWDKFKAMLDGLNGETHFKRIVDIRSRPVDGLEGKELSNLVELKAYYALDANRSSKAHENQLNDVFKALVTQAES